MNSTFHSSLTYRFSYFITFSIFLALINSSLLQNPQLQHDDYNFFSWTRSKSFSHPQIPFVFALGRPISALHIYFVDKAVSRIEHLTYFRILSIIILAFVGSMLFYWLQKTKLTTFESFGISLIVLILPGCLFFINLVLASSYIFPLILSLVASILLFKTTLISTNTSSRYILFFYLSASSFLILVSLFIYPSTTTLFFIPPIAYYLFKIEHDQDIFKKFAYISLFVFLFSSVIYFVISRFVIIPFAINRWDSARQITEVNFGAYKFDLTTNIIEKFEFLFFRILPTSAHLWDVYNNSFILCLLILVILFAIFKVLNIFVFERHLIDFKAFFSLISSRFGSFSLFFLLVLCTCLPSLVSQGNFLPYRVVIPSQVALILIAYKLILLFRLSTFFRYLIIFLFIVISSFFSFFLVRDTVSNNRLQLEHICTVLELNSNIQNVHIIEPPNDQLIGYSGKRVINDEFNMISRAYPLMIRTCLASDPGARKWELRRRMPTVTRSISTNSLIFAPKNSQFIDLSIPLKIESIRNFPVASVQASSFAYSSDVYGGDFPTNLFDDRHDTFWQTTFGFPQTMQIDFPKEIMLKAYSLKIMDNPDLAPLDWVLLTSLDGKNFIQVDKREGINYWKSYQEITFELNKVIKFKSLRLIINKGLGTYLKIDSLKIFAK